MNCKVVVGCPYVPIAAEHPESNYSANFVSVGTEGCRVGTEPYSIGESAASSLAGSCGWFCVEMDSQESERQV